MATTTYYYQDADRISEGTIEIPATARPDFESCWLFAFPKSGSVLVNSIAISLAAEAGVPTIDLPVHLFLKGIHLDCVQFDFGAVFLPRGYIFIGFRSLPMAASGMLSKMAGRKILVVRDPRDMLVSLYYSAKFSHDLSVHGTEQFKWLVCSVRQDTEAEIDDYCLFTAWKMNELLSSYSQILGDPNTLILRYEDFIRDKVAIGPLDL